MSDATNTTTSQVAKPETVSQPKVTDAQENHDAATGVRAEAEAAKIAAEAKRIEADAEARKASADQYARAMQVQSTYMNPNTWTQIRTMAKVFFEGKALPSCIQNEAQLIMVMQAGFEMGMKPVECLKSLYIVKGTVNVYGAAVIRRLREHGWRVTYKDETDLSCTARVVRDREAYEETYTFAQAEKSGHTKDNNGALKVGWKEGINRKLKLRYGVLSTIIKSYIPDVLGSASDIAEVAEDAVIVETTPVKGGETATVTTGNGEPISHKSLADKLAEAKANKQAKASGAAATPPEVNKAVAEAEVVAKEEEN